MARSRRARVGKGSDAADLVVRVTHRELGYAGRLRVVRPGQETLERTVTGDHCADVADALAFIAALTLDPEATSEPRDKAPRASTPPAPPPSRAPAPGLSWAFGGGAYLAPWQNAIPEPELGYGVFLRAASSGATLAPSLLVFAERLPGGTVSRLSGSAVFTLLDGGFELCPVRLPRAGTLGIALCAGFSAGALQARGEGVFLARRPTRTWLAVFASARAEWGFAAPFFALAELGAGVPLERQHYSFDSGESVFDTPAVTGFSRIGVGVDFF